MLRLRWDYIFFTTLHFESAVLCFVVSVSDYILFVQNKKRFNLNIALTSGTTSMHSVL